MSDQKDIIGIVNELQTMYAIRDKETRVMRVHRYNQQMMEHFPRIAQALLIAVEALKKISSEAEPNADHPIPNAIQANFSFGKMTQISKEALSRIRSL